MIRASIVSAGRNVLLTENNPTIDDPVINDTQDLLGYNVYRDVALDGAYATKLNGSPKS